MPGSGAYVDSTRGMGRRTTETSTPRERKNAASWSELVTATPPDSRQACAKRRYAGVRRAKRSSPSSGWGTSWKLTLRRRRPTRSSRCDTAWSGLGPKRWSVNVVWMNRSGNGTSPKVSSRSTGAPAVEASESAYSVTPCPSGPTTRWTGRLIQQTPTVRGWQCARRGVQGRARRVPAVSGSDPTARR